MKTKIFVIAQILKNGFDELDSGISLNT